MVAAQKNLHEVIQEKRYIIAGSTLGVSAGRIMSRNPYKRRSIDL